MYFVNTGLTDFHADLHTENILQPTALFFANIAQATWAKDC